MGSKISFILSSYRGLSSSNNSTFTIKSVSTNNDFVIVEEETTNESSDGSTTITIDHVGFVTDKVKGDGYYSQPDGTHTVAYKLAATLTGEIKMQGS